MQSYRGAMLKSLVMRLQMRTEQSWRHHRWVIEVEESNIIAPLNWDHQGLTKLSAYPRYIEYKL